jgi:hypothetical protein
MDGESNPAVKKIPPQSRGGEDNARGLGARYRDQEVAAGVFAVIAAIGALVDF